jgi:hypothetical protein
MGLVFFLRIFFSQLCQGQIITCAKGGEKNKWNERNTQAEGEKGGRERRDRKKEWKNEGKEERKEGRKGRNAKAT